MSIGRVDRGLRSPIRGQGDVVKTAGTPQREEHVGARLLQQVSERDLDLFMQARAQKAAGTQGGVVGFLQKLIGGAPKPEQRGSDVKAGVQQTLGQLSQIYADGYVSEHEYVALAHARDRMRGVLKLADPDVMNMLPRNVRERLELQLFQPLQLMTNAASRRLTRVWDKIEARDAAQLKQRLNEPLEFRTLDLNVLQRAGLSPTSLARYVPGDLICVPRSDGTFSKGVVVGNFGDRLDVEMLDGARGAEVLRKKSLTANEVAAANPVKLGDYFVAPNGDGIFVADVHPHHGIVGDVQRAGIDRFRVDVGYVRNAIHDALPHYHQTIAPMALGAVPGFLHLSPGLQRTLTALLSLRGDPVFDRVVEELRRQVKSPELTRLPQHEQANRLLGTLHRSDLLHSVMPNFGAVRTNLAITRYQQGRVERGDAYFDVAPGKPPPNAIVHATTLKIGQAQRTFDIVLPESWSPEQRTKTMRELVTVLGTLPPEALSSMQRIVMNPERCPSDSFFAQQFNMPDFTSAMTASGHTRSITVYPSTSVQSALQSFVHEVGHLVSIDAFGSIDGSGPGWNAWNQAIQNDLVAVSRYAQKANSEDFAETYSLYMSTKGTARHDEYRALMPHRFAILDEIWRQATAA